MHVAIISSEAVPFAKTGGLGDVASALPAALAKLGVDASLALPFYGQVNRTLAGRLLFDRFDLEWRAQTRSVSVWQSDILGPPAYLIEAPEFFARPSIYGFSDDHERFAFFSRAALSLFRALGRPLDILHLNDWPGGFAAVELRNRRLFDPFFLPTRTVFSIHNIAYQGTFDPGDLWWMDFGDDRNRDAFMFSGVASALKAGLMSCDAISTVSRRYALEIQTREHGHGLDWLLRARRDRMLGITNGVDYEVWNPGTDPHIAANYSEEDLEGKRKCKLALLRRFGLPEELERPIIAVISRLVTQKGYDLIREAAGAIQQTGAFFVALGTGERVYEDFLQSWHNSAPNQVGIYIGYAGEQLAHQIEAGADIFLMPSLYEPCGLNQMYSMRYGTIPVVRATGGLDDTVEHFNPITGRGTGFKFGPYSASALLEKLQEALYFYREPQIWRKIQVNGMRTDHSWSAAAQKYVDLYRAVLALG